MRAMKKQQQFRIIPTIAAGLCLTLVSCSSDQTFKVIDWKATSGEERPVEITTKGFTTQDVTVQSQTVRVLRSYQRHGSFLVDGGYLQKIYSPTGELRYANGRVIESKKLPDSASLSELDKNTYIILNRARSKYNDLGNAAKLFPARWVLVEDWGSYNPVLRVAFLNADETQVTRVDITPSGQIVDRKNVGHSLDIGLASVFPQGPNLSELAEVVLENLSGLGTLESQELSVSTASTAQAYSEQLIFKYEPQDERFDQVQAYYYMDRFLDHYSDNHGLNLPFPLSAKVHVGFPERRNVAFYYEGNIRLGTGDDRSYHKMAHDPSIVMHEAAHAIIDAFSGLPREDEGGSINEGFADFLAANVLDNPKMAEASYLPGPYKRNIANGNTMADLTGGLYGDSLVVSGTLWELRALLGPKKSAAFAIAALSHLGPSGRFADLGKAFQTALDDHQVKEDYVMIQRVLEHRGWL